MGKRKVDLRLVLKLKEQLHKIFMTKGGGVAKEAFGEDDFLNNMSCRVNAGEELTPEQREKIEAIWRRECSGKRDATENDPSP